MYFEPSPFANLRDLEGTRVAGGVVRSGRLWRADDPSLAPTEGLGDLVGAGLTDIVDLRGDFEHQLIGIGRIADHPLRHHRVELQARARPELAAAIAEGGHGYEGQVGRLYADMVQSNGPALVRVLRVVADARGGTLLHCSAGKDRTGVAVATVLGVLGAADETIAADYAQSDENMPAIAVRVEPLLRAIRPSSPEATAPVQWSVFMAAPYEAMISMLSILRREHGGLREYLRTAGLAPEVERRLQARLVQPVAGSTTAAASVV